jgi:glycosyltransferase involved in cell wall biosynthesis
MSEHANRHPPPGLVSVIIPVRNGADTLGEQLEALAAQEYDGPWEVLVVDNGSTDGTVAVAQQWEASLPRLRVIDASQHSGSSYARNVGAREAAGDFLAFCDADDVVVVGWLSALAAAARDFDAVTGRQDASMINDPDVQQWRSPRAPGLPQARFLPFAPSSNLGVWADVFAATRGFDEEYPQAHDVEWSWRAQLASYTLGFAPDAVVHYRYRGDLRGVARQAYLSGIDTARLARDYRIHGMRRRPLKRVLRTWGWIVLRLPLLFSSARRGLWVRRAAESAGRVVGSVRFGVLSL